VAFFGLTTAFKMSHSVLKVYGTPSGEAFAFFLVLLVKTGGGGGGGGAQIFGPEKSIYQTTLVLI